MKFKDYDDLQIDVGHRWTTVDLCEECLDKLYEVICEFCKGDVKDDERQR